MRKRSELVLLSFWLLCPLLIPWLLSKLLAPMYLVRYTISASPALYLLLAYAAATIHEAVPEPAILGVVAILVAPGLHQYYVETTKENWRAAARYVEEKARPGDSILIPDDGWQRTFDWYHAGPMQDCAMDKSQRGRGDDGSIFAAAAACTPDSDRIWVVLRWWGRGRLDEEAWRSAGLRLVDEPRFHGVLVYLFEKAGENGDANTPGCLAVASPTTSPWETVACS